MVNSDKNVKNLKDAKIQVTVIDSTNLTGVKPINWPGYQIRDGNLHRLTLSNTDIIPGLHANIFSLTQALQKGFQVTSEGNTLILKKNSTNICFGEKMANNSGKGFILTTKFYKIMINDVILYP